jgi:YD repeat-containing protein
MGRLYGNYNCQGSTQQDCNGGIEPYGWTDLRKGSQVTAINGTILNQHFDFGYDEFNRLTSASAPYNVVQGFTYTYDRWGNRTQQSVTQGSGPAPSYNFSNNQAQAVGFSYNAAGNLTNDSMHSYTYDADGNVLQVDGGSTATYVYDVLGRRVQVKTPGGNFESLYDSSGRSISSWSGSTQTPIEGRIYWGSQQIAYHPAKYGNLLRLSGLRGDGEDADRLGWQHSRDLQITALGRRLFPKRKRKRLGHEQRALCST